MRAAPCTPVVALQQHAFNQTECVWQSPAAFCPKPRDQLRSGIGAATGGPERQCLPIEPLPLSDWRLDASRSKGTATGWLEDKYVVYKPELAAGLQPGRFPARVYVDIGANSYTSSVGKWFRTRYPEGNSFRVYAFEPDTRFHRSYRERDVTLLPFAAWVENTTITWALDRHRAGGGGHVATTLGSAGAKRAVLGASAAPGRPLVSHRAIDIADFLTRTVQADDFVVVKMVRPPLLGRRCVVALCRPPAGHSGACMLTHSRVPQDAEGAEYTLVPHLLQSGAARLIDEMFVEVHTEVNSCCRRASRYTPLRHRYTPGYSCFRRASRRHGSRNSRTARSASRSMRTRHPPSHSIERAASLPCALGRL